MEKGVIRCPRCRSTKNTNPEKIGEICQCYDCGNFWEKEEEKEETFELPKSMQIS